jgi:hypothetical protein
MSPAEVVKRLGESSLILYSHIKYRDPSRWPYHRFAPEDISLKLHNLPGYLLKSHWTRYQVCNYKFDLTKELNWYFSDQNNSRWPNCHYSKINYRSGNPYGDVRINWELNRLQFLPSMSVFDEDLTRHILRDWLKKNLYLHGPAYLASMEVALRWISVYWAVCLFKKPIEPSLLKELTGLAFASGKYIKSRLSTHSSAGNHLIIEAVGLFWIGKALEDTSMGTKWIDYAREILREQICRQIHPDGSNREQTFWYLGFVLDAVFHYYLLDDRERIHRDVRDRIIAALEFINEMTLSDGSFPDLGDRDDGFVFRLHCNYDTSLFPGLLNVGAFYYNRPEWQRDSRSAKDRLSFWMGKYPTKTFGKNPQSGISKQPSLKVYSNGGMSLMRYGKGRLLFRHSPLGIEPTYGHGHADALSVLLFWDNTPVLIDLGSGQYNGDQNIRNFFRSTIAHNTVEVGGRSQARMLGPFMWDQPYKAELIKTDTGAGLFAEACHDGYVKEFSITHTRSVSWSKPHEIEIRDEFSGPAGVPIRGAFHLGKCKNVIEKSDRIEADFGNFSILFFMLQLPSLKIYFGSRDPFIGWRSTIYGAWEPIHSIVYSSRLQKNTSYTITLRIAEN